MSELPTLSEKDTLSFAAGKWGPCPRLSRNIPFGYMIDPTNEKMLLPIVKELEALEEAKGHLKRGYGLRTVAKWLEGETGRPISHEGLKRRVNTDVSNVRRATTLRSWAERIASAAQDVRTFDRKVGNSTEWYDSFIQNLVDSIQRSSEEADRGDYYNIYGGLQTKPRSSN